MQKKINNLEVSDVLKCIKKTNLFIDVRDKRNPKIWPYIRSKTCSKVYVRVLDNPEPYHKKFFNDDYHFIFYCASDWRSALATVSANEIGLLNTSHLVGGFNKWLDENGPIAKPR